DRADADGIRRADIGLDRTARLKCREPVGHAIAGEEGRMVVDMHVQMRLGGAAGIADMADHVADADRIADLYAPGARAHVRIENEPTRCYLDDDMIASRVIKGDRYGILA